MFRLIVWKYFQKTTGYIFGSTCYERVWKLQDRGLHVQVTSLSILRWLRCQMTANQASQKIAEFIVCFFFRIGEIWCNFLRLSGNLNSCLLQDQHHPPPTRHTSPPRKMSHVFWLEVPNDINEQQSWWWESHIPQCWGSSYLWIFWQPILQIATLPETNAASEIWWVEDDPFILWLCLFSRANC